MWYHPRYEKFPKSTNNQNIAFYINSYEKPYKNFPIFLKFNEIISGKTFAEIRIFSIIDPKKRKNYLKRNVFLYYSH